MKLNKIKIAIDSPAGAGAGTQSKLLSKHYNLFYLDTGKFYRVLAYDKIKNPDKFNLKYIKKRIKKIKLKDLNHKKLLPNEIGIEASKISKNRIIRKLIDGIQKNMLTDHLRNIMVLVWMEGILPIKFYQMQILNFFLLQISKQERKDDIWS